MPSSPKIDKEAMEVKPFISRLEELIAIKEDIIATTTRESLQYTSMIGMSSMSDLDVIEHVMV